MTNYKTKQKKRKRKMIKRMLICIPWQVHKGQAVPFMPWKAPRTWQSLPRGLFLGTLDTVLMSKSGPVKNLIPSRPRGVFHRVFHTACYGKVTQDLAVIAENKGRDTRTRNSL